VRLAQKEGEMLEHYGITLAKSAAVTITEQHAHAITQAQMMPLARHATAALTLVAQTDGSMIPVVQTGSGTGGDLRKTRTLAWRASPAGPGQTGR